VDAIKRIEEKNSKLITLNTESTKKYVVSNLQKILSVLDEYEKKLMENALKSIL